MNGAHKSSVVWKKNWKFDLDISLNKRTLKDKSKELLSKYLRIDADYKNYNTVELSKSTEN